ncbi:LptA/OstA family protein [Sphingomonas sp.]|jgi:lipopolysaccharide export system protein LptA|uniref:LptA/OstA family protein n=1 Tax=Sphingomonas sp. TaxID=28214 RepID=UPI002D7E594A|nr:LptA/OstA family protein [Sphingomonas sp.]HEU0043250.1 LptA/OstA family protein [Sphingomonas sp.]
MRPVLLVLALLAAPSLAQTRHNTAAPIDFGADTIELQDRANRAVLSGNVSVRQAGMNLNAARMTVAYTGQVFGGNPQVSRLDASGGVTVRRPDQTARSSYAIYDLNRRVITMLGAVTLNQGPNTVNGGRLTINLDTGRAVIDGSSVGSRGSGAASGTATRGGRVTGTFSVPDRR